MSSQELRGKSINEPLNEQSKEQSNEPLNENLRKQLKEQVEFYFSDANFARDKFMIARASENDGFIPISVLVTFKRLKMMGATIEKIKEAVKDSKVVELKDDTLRKMETQEFKDYINDKEIDKKIIHVKGFDLGCDLDDIRNILSEYIKPVRITLRRSSDKKFTGSCYIEMASEEEARKALELKIEQPSKNKTTENDEHPKKSKIESEFLEMMMKEDYLASKKDSRDDGKKDEKFAERVKANFIPKLYKYECDIPLEISEIKEVVKSAAFVDTIKMVIRKKYVEDIQEEEYEIKKNTDGKEKVYKLRLTRLPEDEAKEYVSVLNIRKTSEKRKY